MKKGPPRKPFPMKVCAHCDREFEPRRFRKDNGHSMGRSPNALYCSGTCRNLARGESRGYIHHTGYRYVSCGKRGKSAPEHRVVMEKKIGRKLARDETVHHKNGDRLDNHPENLELWTGRHGRGQRVSDLMPFVCNDHVLGMLSLGA
jgi:hypothetical protein